MFKCRDGLHRADDRIETRIFPSLMSVLSLCAVLTAFRNALATMSLLAVNVQYSETLFFREASRGPC